MKKEIEATIRLFHDKTQFSIGIIEYDKVEFIGCIKEKEEIKWIDNSHSIFEIGSITKIFTANILSQLVNQAKISLDESIKNHLPVSSLKNEEITFKQLANHTSGLPRLPDNFYEVEGYDKENPYPSYTERALIDYLKNRLKLTSKPGEKLSYSNLGYGVLSYLISKIEDKSFETVVTERIFNAHGMLNSSFKTHSKAPNFVKGLDENGQETSNWNGGILNGCIGIHSSVQDMVLFMKELINPKNKHANLQAKTTHQIEDNYSIGLGFGIRKKGNTILHSHGGGSKGYNSYMKLNREKSSGLIILTNVSAFDKDRIKIEKLSTKMMA